MYEFVFLLPYVVLVHQHNGHGNYKKSISLFLNQKHVVGTQKNHLNDPKQMFKLMDKKIFTVVVYLVLSIVYYLL